LEVESGKKSKTEQNSSRMYQTATKQGCATVNIQVIILFYFIFWHFT